MINPFKTIYYQLYLLQLEEYNLSRYFNLIKKTPRTKKQLRKTLRWTPKLILIECIAILLQTGLTLLAVLIFFAYIPSIAVAVILSLTIFILLSYIHHLFLMGSVFITHPLDTILKKRVIHQAKMKLKSHGQLTIIGIAGSYGKTTMKETLATILGQKYQVLKTPENTNTPIGISRLIMTKLTPEIEIFIVEMGEYYKGDITAICKITPPDIAVITGINEAHLERMGSLETTTSTIFEIVEGSKSQALVVLNADDEHVLHSYKNFIGSKHHVLYSSTSEGEIEIKNWQFHPDKPKISFDLYERGLHVGNFKVAILGSYIIGNIVAAVLIAQKLHLTLVEIVAGIPQLKPVKHRLEPIYNSHTNVQVIDDSYNGNPNGVKEAIRVLSQFKNRRKLYVTPGLVETGEKNHEIHYNIGKQLVEVADIVILIRNSATPHIADGLTENGYDKNNIVWFDDARQAHDSLSKIVKSNDVILFQNDWPDNYL